MPCLPVHALFPACQAISLNGTHWRIAPCRNFGGLLREIVGDIGIGSARRIVYDEELRAELTSPVRRLHEVDRSTIRHKPVIPYAAFHDELRSIVRLHPMYYRIIFLLNLGITDREQCLPTSMSLLRLGLCPADIARKEGDGRDRRLCRAILDLARMGEINQRVVRLVIDTCDDELLPDQARPL